MAKSSRSRKGQQEIGAEDLLCGKLLKRYYERNSLFGEEFDWDNSYIWDNLKDTPRPYQTQTLEFFHDTQSSSKREENFSHLLFNLATGAGKTMIMAATVLYLFKEKNYQNFLFFVHTDGILQKTIDNLLNKSSIKYLFTEEIVIDGRVVRIQMVDVFPKIRDANTIYLKMSTIHKLHSDLNNPRENSLTYSDLSEYPVVMLADEAHHYNAVTQNTNTKREEARAWESTIDLIKKSHPKNMLLEFTATIELTNEQILKKYKHKILQKYDLKQFMEDGYSKKVYLLQINQDDKTKMIDAVLLSQYRKLIAIKNGIRAFKPVVLFKSNTISVSLKAHEDFNVLIQNLSIDDIRKHLNSKKVLMSDKPGSIWNTLAKFYLDEERDLLDVLSGIQHDFQEKNIINANSSDLLNGENFKILNSLEDKNNPIRVVFAVAKLSEGWDVLNLFDIVRISEQASTTSNSTNQEAQLIGRGARYYPFLQSIDRLNKRQFDNSTSELAILECLHYHTINEVSYIQNLNISLAKERVAVSTDGHSWVCKSKVKDSFKKHKLYQSGKIYLNKATKHDDTKRKFNSYSIGSEIQISYKIADENLLNNISTSNIINELNHDIKLEYLEVPLRIVQKAIQRQKFYQFDNLLMYFPSLKSITEFIENFLKSIKIQVALPSNMSLSSLLPKEKLYLVELALSKIANNLRKNYAKSIGTRQFYGVAIQDYIKDYEILIDESPTNDITQLITDKAMDSKSWYVYDRAPLNQLEHRMVAKLEGAIKKLQQRYDDVYLVRIDERSSNFKLIEFDGVRGFMPDFLLLLSDKKQNRFYQVILEPKGEPYYTRDKWKEEMLEEISNENIIIEENDDVRLIGVRFYREFHDGEKDYNQMFFSELSSKIYSGEPLLNEPTLINVSNIQKDLFE